MVLLANEVLAMAENVNLTQPKQGAGVVQIEGAVLKPAKAGGIDILDRAVVNLVEEGVAIIDGVAAGGSIIQEAIGNNECVRANILEGAAVILTDAGVNVIESPAVGIISAVEPGKDVTACIISANNDENNKANHLAQSVESIKGDSEVIKKCVDVHISEADSTARGSVDTDCKTEDVQVSVVESTTSSDDGYCSTDQDKISAESLQTDAVKNLDINDASSSSFILPKYCDEDWEIPVEGLEDRSFVIKNIAGKGNGMFASKRIYPGEIILREIPLMIVLDEVYSDSEKCEKYLDKVVDKMTDLERRRFLSLWDGRNEDPTYLGRFYTNDMDWDGDICVCPSMARANHSCRPNADFYTRKDLGEQRLVAISIIEEGAEITISYLPSADEGSDIRSRRQNHLLFYWGFLCTCIECTLQDKELEENEIIREEIKEIQSPGLENVSIQELEHLYKLCKMIGVKPYYELLIFEEIYNKSSTREDKYYQCVRALVAAIHSYGVGSGVAIKWQEKLELDEFDKLQF